MESKSGTKLLRVVRLGTLEYERALELMERLVAARLCEAVPDTLLLLEHLPVYTLGRGASERHVLALPPQVPLYRVSRGGQVTFHGPGQLVGYPILGLEGAERDVLRYLRKLEQAIIAAMAEAGIATAQRAGFTGAWCGQRKLASIGVGIRKWTTFHGFALNVRTDLTFFDAIVPCGLEGVRMTSVAEQGRPDLSVDETATLVRDAFCRIFGFETVDDQQAADNPVDLATVGLQARN